MKIKKQNRTSLIVALSLLAVIAAMAVWFFFYANNASRTDKDGINYSPATKDDKELNDQIKQDLPVKDNADPSEPETSVASVRPVITAWGQPTGPGTDFQLNGFVDGIVESDGECTLTMKKDDQTATVTKKALQNAQNTSCGQMVISYAKLTPGTWKATLSYTSSTSEGSSDPVTVEVK